MLINNTVELLSHTYMQGDSIVFVVIHIIEYCPILISRHLIVLSGMSLSLCQYWQKAFTSKYKEQEHYKI